MRLTQKILILSLLWGGGCAGSRLQPKNQTSSETEIVEATGSAAIINGDLLQARKLPWPTLNGEP